MPTTHGRNTGNYQQIQAALRRRRLPCWLCGHPNAFSADHVQPLSTHPHLAEVESNLRAAHRRCNLGRGNRAPALSIGEPSRRW